MRHAFALALVAIVLWSGHVTAASSLAARSPDGKRVAEVRTRERGGDALWVDGKPVWPAAERKATITAKPSWARSGHAVALLAREAGGATTLVVALVGGDAGGQALEWSIPPAALPARAIMWMGASKLAVGPREMEPRLVASWNEPVQTAAR